MAGRRLSLAVAAALLAAPAGCKRGSGAIGGDSTTTSVPPAETTATEPTTPATTAPSYAVPDVIDAAYIETVMKALDHVYGDAVRLLARNRSIDEAFIDQLAAIYGDREFEFQQEIWLRSRQQGFVGIAGTPGDPVTRVQRVTKASATCIVAAVERDLDPTLSQPDQPRPQKYVALAPKPQRRDRIGVNPTPWLLAFDGWVDDGSEPEDPCP